jgi:hypothetical protein
VTFDLAALDPPADAALEVHDLPRPILPGPERKEQGGRNKAAGTRRPPKEGADPAFDKNLDD